MLRYQLGIDREALPLDRLRKRLAQFEERQTQQTDRRPLNQLPDSGISLAEEAEHNNSNISCSSSFSRGRRPSLQIFDECKPKKVNNSSNVVKKHRNRRI